MKNRWLYRWRVLKSCNTSDNAEFPPPFWNLKHPENPTFQILLNIQSPKRWGLLLYTVIHLQILFQASFEELQLISFPYILNLLQIYLILNNYYSLVKGICYYRALHSHKLSVWCILINLCQSCINLILFKFNKDQNISKHKYPWEKQILCIVIEWPIQGYNM